MRQIGESVRYTFQSRADLIDLWLHIATSSPAAADDCLNRIETRGKQLETFPEIGPERPDIAPGARALVIDRWLVIYRIQSNGVQIVRIVDGSRDLARLPLPRD